jgi:hypothetical protein
MQVLPFGGGRELSVSIGQSIALHWGAGLHRLTCPVKLDARNTVGGGVPVAVSGWASLTMTGTDWLRGWSAERPVVTREGQPFDTTLVLPLTDEQLAVIEQRRAGGDLILQLDGNIVLGYDPAVAGGSDNDR